MRIVRRSQDGVARPVLWTRGQGCRELAEMLSEVEPVRVVGDIGEACIRHGAELLVSRKLSASFDLINTAVPVDMDPDSMSTVVAAVAGGPHSELAVRVSERLARSTDRQALVTCAFQEEEDRERAVATIERLRAAVPGVEYRLVKAADAGELVSQLPERSLLVIGAPGGGWLQRTFFGPGAKLRSGAPAGAVVVRRAPDRVFQLMTDPQFVGPLREAVDILRLHSEPVLAVVDRAVLIGVVRRSSLELADPGVPVEALMEAPASVSMTAAVSEAAGLGERFRGGAIPVVDDDGRLVGALPADIAARSH
ncbi:MAG: CBS domain-containing protein [Acidimicrobiia bacterium]